MPSGPNSMMGIGGMNMGMMHPSNPTAPGYNAFGFYL